MRPDSPFAHVATANYCSFDTQNSIDHGFRRRENFNYWLLWARS
ncbi:one cut domain, family member 1, isoform CRA_d [Rattus norvegicus]|uniref:One cut domain, family member 1, isoform CRA_d n=1 Tax=Rattus norvegicus TaxID=10116 RepID=A6I1A2_RAT|nr:one cut domain, family member 1, isoform CRA_d [Rattus norvegicus]